MKDGNAERSWEINLQTFHQNSARLVHIFEADHQCLSKWINHGEEHPNLNQLDVGGGRKGLADSKKTETFTFSIFCEWPSKKKTIHGWM